MMNVSQLDQFAEVAAMYHMKKVTSPTTAIAYRFRTR